MRADERYFIIAAAMEPNDRIIGTREVAELIGKSQRWVQMEAENGRLSHIAQRAGRWFVFRRSDIDAWLEEHTVQPAASH